MSEAIGNGDRVELRGFGAFSSKRREARIGRNPKTGEDVEISPRRVVTFKAGQKFKVRVEGNVAS